MLSLKSNNKSNKTPTKTKTINEKAQAKKIERELPYFITIVTLLATAGLGPYFIFQKLKTINLLPTLRDESEKILKRIDMLGIDPLSAMAQAVEKPSAKALGEFLSGYVSAIQTGGNVINYLKSKMTTVFDRYTEKEKSSIEKVNAIIEAYMTIQIVVLAVYIMISAMGANNTENSPSTGFDAKYLVLILPPLISFMFCIMTRNMSAVKVKELPIKEAVKYAIPVLTIFVILLLTNVFSKMHLNAILFGIVLAIICIIPSRKYAKIHRLNLAADSATPQILRDITEARKAGIGPEKCVIHACSRKDYKEFTTIANSISSKLEWGIPLNNIFDVLQKEIENFQVLISFRILIEIISSGGGSVQTLDSLAETSEKFHNIEKNKREMLSPYVMIGFVLIGMTGFITLVVIDVFSSVSVSSALSGPKTSNDKTQATIELYSGSVIAQSFLAGFFLGKITDGAFSAGYKIAMRLVLVSLIAVSMIQFHLIDFGSILGNK